MTTTDERTMSPHLQSWLGVVGIVAAPLSAITALFYYFGRVSTNAQMTYLGLSPDLVGFTTNDYVAQSANVLYFVALWSLVVCAAVLAFCLGFRSLVRRGRHQVALRRVALTVLILGIGALLRGVHGVWSPASYDNDRQWQTPAALAIGAALLLLGEWLRRACDDPTQTALPPTRVGQAIFGINAVVLILAIFASTNAFAAKAGTVEGINAVARLWSTNSTVILDTPDQLELPSELIKVRTLPGRDAQQQPTYRYECFRPVAVRGDRWVLMPAGWKREFGFTVIVTADASHRIMLRNIKDTGPDIGDGPNVRDYWPCPEFVKTVKGDDIVTQLLSFEDVKRVAQVPAFPVTNEYVQRPQRDSAPRAPSCAEAVNPTAYEPGRDSGFLRRSGREMVDPASQTRMDESVIEFATPRQASAYFEPIRSQWDACKKSTITVGTQRITVGDLSEDHHVWTLVVKTSNEPGGQCARASAAISNVVSDVVACGPKASERATAVATAIRDRFPKE
ncbi:sensor domain-containing protein [Mycolicibacterium sp. NCC-Tsukiji]|uniref:sensor domain-containing protein n=1 Tax=Mycolicibacterium sp. NCC-Tsukiji TaxID=2185272 RepID=UPI00107F1924|nr:sensor domain-containing protein [Mycolicibacterium sp. NCC-Tsukiji]